MERIDARTISYFPRESKPARERGRESRGFISRRRIWRRGAGFLEERLNIFDSPYLARLLLFMSSREVAEWGSGWRDGSLAVEKKEEQKEGKRRHISFDIKSRTSAIFRWVFEKLSNFKKTRRAFLPIWKKNKATRCSEMMARSFSLLSKLTSVWYFVTCKYAIETKGGKSLRFDGNRCFYHHLSPFFSKCPFFSHFSLLIT